MIRYCVHCWERNAAAAPRCAGCGRLLTEADPSDYVAKLIRALRHPEPTTPVRAAWILGELRAPGAVEPLRDVLRTSGDPDLLRAAALALGAIADPAAVPELAALLRRSYVAVRLACVEALARIGGPEAVAALREAAHGDPSPTVRERAAAAVPLDRPSSPPYAG